MTTVTAPPAGAERAGVPRAAWAVLAVVLAAEIMDLIDATVTAIAAPAIRADLGGSEASMQWLGAAYTLPFAVLLVTGGRLGDRYGRRRLFLLGLAGFTIASAATALAPGMAALLAARALQGAFGALLIPQGFGLVTEAFRGDLGKAFAAFGPVMGLSAVAGPVLGGWLVDADLLGTGWRAIFLINVPIGLLALAAGARLLPRASGPAGPRPGAAGIGIVTLAAFALVFPLVEGRELGWPLWLFGLLAAGLLGLAGFVAFERRHPANAVIEPSLLRNRTYLSGMAVVLGFFAAMTGFTLTMSLFCQLGLGFSASRTGLALAPMSFGIAAAAAGAFALTPRFGRRVIHAGALVMIAGVGLVAAMVHGAGDATTVWTIAPGAFLGGAGIGLVVGPLFDVILAGVTEPEVGSASGVLNAVQQLAGAIGVAVVPTVYLGRLDAGAAAPDALLAAVAVVLALGAVTFALAFVLPRRARDQPAH